MNVIESRQDPEIDKSAWPKGPWHAEPDYIHWEFEDMDCLIVRNAIGALCGYVAVEPGHPAYKKDYNEVGIRVHGGLTYSDMCAGHICHVPREGRPDHVWWLGFDCAHLGDFSPAYEKQGHYDYKDVAYVKYETEELARQLKAMVIS